MGGRGNSGRVDKTSLNDSTLGETRVWRAESKRCSRFLLVASSSTKNQVDANGSSCFPDTLFFFAKLFQACFKERTADCFECLERGESKDIGERKAQETLNEGVDWNRRYKERRWLPEHRLRVGYQGTFFLRVIAESNIEVEVV